MKPNGRAFLSFVVLMLLCSLAGTAGDREAARVYYVGFMVIGTLIFGFDD